MRTDAKIGLICGGVVLAGILAYSVMHTSHTAGQQTKGQESAPVFGPQHASGQVPVPVPSTGPTLDVPDRFPTSMPAPHPTQFADPGDTPFPNPTTHQGFQTPPAHTPPVTHTPTPPVDPAPPADGVTSTGTVYSIVNGDTLGKIAKQFHVTLKALQAANPTADSNHLKLKQKINIPAPAPATVTPAPGSGATGGTGTHGATTVPADGTTYKVKAGDNLEKIAKALYGKASLYTKILQANKDRITNEDQIKDGMVLKIPPK